MNGQQARLATGFVVLAILIPCAVLSPVSTPVLPMGDSRVEEPHRPRRPYGTWLMAVGAAPVHAAEPVLIRAGVAKASPVLVGEHVVMIIELLTVTTFASAPMFNLPKIPGAILMQLE